MYYFVWAVTACKEASPRNKMLHRTWFSDVQTNRSECLIGTLNIPVTFSCNGADPAPFASGSKVKILSLCSRFTSR